ncbi:ACT domain-containing protein [Photobacterium rosenbergii]|uniref:ACT domain-containing protein n=1 Tax=Photobacterium rosenbergii TaxID=294936 RepID=UPI001C993300|nr:ACT domain-containing protein [Photobacterium rosenbergii]MBY5946128.1 ACT domain-containing protein [Photobacterium rosenbergii]
MSGITDLQQLLKSMAPELKDGEFVFCTVEGDLSQYVGLSPISTFQEQEGLTLVLGKDNADKAGLAYEGTFRMITLTVHSSLEAVGLTAAVASKLAERGISANVIAAYYHDHVFVQSAKATEALEALRSFSS